MTKAYFKCGACGQQVAVVGRNRKDADGLAAYREQRGALCPDCWATAQQEKRAAQAQAAAEEAAAADLPVLQGTEKQVAWAEVIRSTQLRRIARVESMLEERVFLTEHAAMAFVLRDGIALIRAATTASWWIGARDFDLGEPMYLLSLLAGKPEGSFYGAKLADVVVQARAHMAGLATPPPVPAPQALVDDAKAEATLRPAAPKTETIAEVRALASAIEILFPERRDDFRDLAKGALRCQWTAGRWARSMTSTTGTPADRAAEVAHRLLAAGFCVRVYDPAIRAAALAGSYTPECRRWVQVFREGANNGRLALCWSRPDDLYGVAKRIPGARWDGTAHCMAVPVEQFEQVMDFAEIHHFEISDTARTAIDAARELRNRALVAPPVPPPAAPKAERSRAKPSALDVPVAPEVDDDLRDDA